jgi:hypothetical protein
MSEITDSRTRRTGATTKRTRTTRTPEERAAEVEALAEQLSDAVTQLTTSEAWMRMLRVAARFTRYRAGSSGLFEVRECWDLARRGVCGW